MDDLDRNMISAMTKTDTRMHKALEHWKKNPVEAVKDWFHVTPDDWQGDALNAVFSDTDRFAGKSGHGVGKTTFMAWAG